MYPFGRGAPEPCLNHSMDGVMEKKLFGTDGIRGVANKEPMTAETALKVGMALGRLIHAADGGQPAGAVLVGRDTRVSGSMLEAALTAGICSMGVHTLSTGILPTPAIAYLTKTMRGSAGAVISASHNPYQDNGLKFFFSDGFKLSEALETEIENLVHGPVTELSCPIPEGIGVAEHLVDALTRYVVFLKSCFPASVDLSGFKVAVDGANGAAYRAAPQTLEELGASVVTTAVSPDGKNINAGCGSLHPEGLQRLVLETSANVGIALDGDADRVIFVDEKGVVVNGDQIMGLIAWDMQGRGILNSNTVVATVMSNIGLEAALKDIGAHLVRTAVGDKYVVREMREKGFNFGGEQSGHLIFLDHTTSGDGMLSALQVIRVMVETGKPLSELAARVTMFPQVLKNVRVKSRRDLGTIPPVTAVIHEAQGRLKDNGRILVRYSGTELLCRVMAEGENEDVVNSVVDMVVDAISQHV